MVITQNIEKTSGICLLFYIWFRVKNIAHDRDVREIILVRALWSRNLFIVCEPMSIKRACPSCHLWEGAFILDT